MGWFLDECYAANSLKVHQREITPPSALSSRTPLIVAVSSALLCLAVYLLRLDRVAGLLQDDGWYILLAKALASGQGYTLINSPTAGIPLYILRVFPCCSP